MGPWAGRAPEPADLGPTLFSAGVRRSEVCLDGLGRPEENLSVCVMLGKQQPIRLTGPVRDGLPEWVSHGSVMNVDEASGRASVPD